MADEDSSVHLQNLIRLQELELELFAVRSKVEETPQEMGALDDQLEADRQRVEDAKKEIEDTGKDRRQIEGEVDTLRQRLSQYQDQLMLVKTNTEYQAMLHEIEFAKRQIEEKEDLILEQLLEADENEKTLREVTEQFTKRQSEVEGRRKELEEFLNRSSLELDALKERIEEVRRQIPREHLARYERIAAARNGLVLVKVLGNSCQGCHVRLRPQLLAEVRTNRQILLCENCSRVLYYSPT
jgi:predicted  nucleic acid-binding Zn-ribbon protein